MELTKDIYGIGVNDYEIDLFEGQYPVENGMSYNSYVIIDEKIAVLDTVDEKFTEEWLNNLKQVLKDKDPDYLIVQHMEPDHSANIKNFMDCYPNTEIVSSVQAFKMMDQFFDLDENISRRIIKEGDELSLGRHVLTFIAAPMVHWPEVMFTYDQKAKVLFSADAFGKFGVVDADEDWVCEARRYYFGIVGKYGMQVQNVLKKAQALEIQMICPLHGPVLKEHLNTYLDLYHTWSFYEAEEQGTVIAYASVYGNTEKAVVELKEQLENRGEKVSLCDLTRCDIAEAVEDAFRYDKLVLATVTYNADIFPCMKSYIHHLIERNYQKRKVAFMENGSWAPVANKVMKNMLDSCKDLTYMQNEVTIRSTMKKDAKEMIDKLANELTEQ